MKIKQGYKVRNIVGENVVVMQGHEGADMTRLIALNDTSLYLWNKLSGGEEFDARRVCDLLTEQYDVEPERALADAEKWIESLAGCGLLE